MLKRMLSLMLALALVVSLCPVQVFATEETQPESADLTASVTYINPEYRDVITEDDLLKPSDAAAIDDTVTPVFYDNLSQAGAAMRPALVERVTAVKGYFWTEDVLSDAAMEQAIYDLFDIAVAHTGVPDEGDYILKQFDGYSAEIQGQYADVGVNWTITYTMTYFTTAAQEAQVNSRLATVLSNLDTGSGTDYEKVKAIYDYLCENVTYDYDNLNDDTYLLKHSAYAALIDGTAVCQGYALLFYRMALELGVDARYISGTTTGGRHGWNITELDNRYYNLDATWDAGEASYSYFLKCDANFGDHNPDSDYTTSAFLSAYPKAGSDYVPATQPPVSDLIASGACGDSLNWKLDREGTLTIYGTGNMYDFADSKAGWYDYRSQIYNIVIEEGMVDLGDEAFDGCYNAVSVSLPSTMNGFGRQAFVTCSSLTSITVSSANPYYTSVNGVLYDKNCTILGQCPAGWVGSFEVPATVREIFDCAFQNCSKLTSVKLNDGITAIGVAAFNHSGLTAINLPGTLTTIWNNAFDSCAKLTSVTFPASLTSIAEEAFADCDGLSEITFLGSAPTIGSTAFANVIATAYYPAGDASWTEAVRQDYYGNLTWVAQGDVPDPEPALIAIGTCGETVSWQLDDTYHLIVYGTGPMDDYTSAANQPWNEYAADISRITVKTGVTSIGDNAFRNLSSLTIVVLEEGVSEIGSYSFYNCQTLNNLTLPQSLTTIGAYAFGSCLCLSWLTLPSGLASMGSGAFRDSGVVETVIPGSLKKISDSAFSGCEEMTSIRISSGVETIGTSAFNGCSGLTQIVFPDSIKVIGQNAFWDCTSLRQAELPTNLQEVGAMAFLRTKVEIFHIPASLTTVGQGAFLSTSLLKFTVDSGSAAFCVQDGVLFTADKGTLVAYPGGRSGGYTIPYGTVTIGNYAMSGAAGLTDLTMPDTLTTFGEGACERSGIRNLLLPDSITSLGFYSFANCLSLEHVSFPGTISNYGQYTFRGCTALNRIAFRGDAGPLHRYVFDGQSATAYYPESNSTWTESIMTKAGSTFTWTSCNHFYMEVMISDATCASYGYSQVFCWQCSDDYLTNYKTPYGHNGELQNRKDPACTAAGYSGDTVCTRCSAVLEEGSVIAALGHAYKSSVTAPTCTAEGYTTYTCSRCKNSYQDDFVDKLSHSFAEYVVTATPSLTEAGQLTGNCTACDTADNVILPELSDTDYTVSVIKASSCKIHGTNRYVWKNSDYGTVYFDVTVPLAEHAYTYNVTVKPTATSTGTLVGACENCVSVVSVELPKLDTVNYTYRETMAPTQTQSGRARYVWKNEEYGVVYFDVTIPPAGNEPENPFTDVPSGAYFEAPVLWALDQGITGGTSATTFGSTQNCTREQVVMFLWNANGAPEPTLTKSPFTDVPMGKYYTKAVLWAYENGIAGGTSATTFGVGKEVTRAQFVTFLYNAMGKPEVTGTTSFTDVPANAYYAKPVLWAVQNGITGGTSATTFSPSKACTRAQVVTFLYQAYGK